MTGRPRLSRSFRCDPAHAACPVEAMLTAVGGRHTTVPGDADVAGFLARWAADVDAVALAVPDTAVEVGTSPAPSRRRPSRRVVRRGLVSLAAAAALAVVAAVSVGPATGSRPSQPAMALTAERQSVELLRHAHRALHVAAGAHALQRKALVREAQLDIAHARALLPLVSDADRRTALAARATHYDHAASTLPHHPTPGPTPTPSGPRTGSASPTPAATATARPTRTPSGVGSPTGPTLQHGAPAGDGARRDRGTAGNGVADGQRAGAPLYPRGRLPDQQPPPGGSTDGTEGFPPPPDGSGDGTAQRQPPPPR